MAPWSIYVAIINRDFHQLKLVDLSLIERWLTGWSLSRGLDRPFHRDGGLVVDVGKPDQLRRHVFLDAGQALQACADRIQDPHIFLKAPVAPDVLRRALPERWRIETPGHLMGCPAPMTGNVALAPAYRLAFDMQKDAHVVRVIHGSDEQAASGRLVVHGGCAIFDQIETAEHHRRRGLGTVVMHALDSIAIRAGAGERLLVATDNGRALYSRLGWQLLSPWSTAVLPSP
jgi:GNAT superfamily N-acetyltransferase